MVGSMKNDKGFTLVEILATVAIIGLGIVPVMEILPSGMDFLRKINHLTRDVMLAEQKIDELRGQILGTNASYGYNKAGGYGDSGIFAGFTDYNYTVTDDQGADIRELSVTVWFDADGGGTQDADEDNVQLDTKIAER